VLADWNNMSLHLDTLFWFWDNSFLLNAAYLAEKHNIPVYKSLV
jgi:arginine deiminase